MPIAKERKKHHGVSPPRPGLCSSSCGHGATKERGRGDLISGGDRGPVGALAPPKINDLLLVSRSTVYNLDKNTCISFVWLMLSKF